MMLMYCWGFQIDILQKDNLHTQNTYNDDKRKHENLETVGQNGSGSDTAHVDITEKEHGSWKCDEIVGEEGDP